MPQSSRRTERQHHLEPGQKRIMKIGRKPLANLSSDGRCAEEVRSHMAMKAAEIRVNQRGGERSHGKHRVASNSLTVKGLVLFARRQQSARRALPCRKRSP